MSSCARLGIGASSLESGMWGLLAQTLELQAASHENFHVEGCQR